MLRSKQEIFQDIDSTLDHLIENAEMLYDISSSNGYEDELHALEKTQESLLAHLVGMDRILEEDGSNEPNYIKAKKDHFCHLEEDKLRAKSSSKKPKGNHSRVKIHSNL